LHRQAHTYTTSRSAKNIAVTDEVHGLLRRSELPGASFSGVIKRNLRKPRLSEIAGTGVLSGEVWEATRKSLAKAERITRRKLSRMP
jgi:predicted CopG family antitoxin